MFYLILLSIFCMTVFKGLPPFEHGLPNAVLSFLINDLVLKFSTVSGTTPLILHNVWSYFSTVLMYAFTGRNIC